MHMAMWNACTIRNRNHAAILDAKSVIEMTICRGCAFWMIHEVATFNTSAKVYFLICASIVHVAMSGRRALHLIHNVAELQASSLMHVAMRRGSAFESAHEIATLHTTRFVHAAVWS
jgi:hypothetical protein